ncbi:hypothetical protein FA15DRAFT_653720 [Coprinopsis marcescibilis]|uniref:Uncharacterized protein n=1 Tax=Coprinopsis marcescibilis TaxID=230819 RepID=A0A5C3L3Q9_COPMA|nr:hypothetical protein FA15DRAFT_653720 [Coprinopsis marcescibilis]
MSSSANAVARATLSESVKQPVDFLGEYYAKLRTTQGQPTSGDQPVWPVIGTSRLRPVYPVGGTPGGVLKYTRVLWSGPEPSAPSVTYIFLDCPQKQKCSYREPKFKTCNDVNCIAHPLHTKLDHHKTTYRCIASCTFKEVEKAPSSITVYLKGCDDCKGIVKMSKALYNRTTREFEDLSTAVLGIDRMQSVVGKLTDLCACAAKYFGGFAPGAKSVY